MGRFFLLKIKTTHLKHFITGFQKSIIFITLELNLSVLIMERNLNILNSTIVVKRMVYNSNSPFFTIHSRMVELKDLMEQS
jgi:hypothetical protein